MQNILQQITAKNLFMIAGIWLLLCCIVMGWMLIRNWLKSVTKNKDERKIWAIKRDPLSEGVTESEKDKLSVNESEVYEEDDSVTPEEEVAFKRLELLAAEIERTLGEKDWERQALLNALANTIRTYTDINKPPYRVAITNLIIRRAKQRCLLTITEEEAKDLWPPA